MFGNIIAVSKQNGTVAVESSNIEDTATNQWKGERWQDENANDNNVVIVVGNEAARPASIVVNEHPMADVEMVLINLNANNNRNSAVIATAIEPIDKRLSSPMNNGQSVDIIVAVSTVPAVTMPVLANGGHSSASSSGDHGVDDDDDNSKDNYDMLEEEEEIVNGHGTNEDDDDDDDDEHIKETDGLVEKNHLNDLEDCDYYSDGDGDDDEREEILKCNGGDGIIANHFVGLYTKYFLLPKTWIFIRLTIFIWALEEKTAAVNWARSFSLPTSYHLVFRT